MDTTPIAIAALGLMGTLAAPLVSQRAARLSRLQEMQHEAQQKETEQRHVDRRTALEQRRDCYIRMNASSRAHRLSLMNYLYILRAGDADTDARAELESTRSTYAMAVSEVQLTAPLAVLAAMEAVTDSLSRSYGQLKEFERDTTRDAHTFESLRASFMDQWALWQPLRKAMRSDLGVAG